MLRSSFRLTTFFHFLPGKNSYNSGEEGGGGGGGGIEFCRQDLHTYITYIYNNHLPFAPSIVIFLEEKKRKKKRGGFGLSITKKKKKKKKGYVVGCDSHQRKGGGGGGGGKATPYVATYTDTLFIFSLFLFPQPPFLK